MVFNFVDSGKFLMPGAAALLLFAAACSPAGGKKAPQKPQMPPAVVRVENVSVIGRGEPKRYVANSVPYELVDIVPRVSGTLTKADGWTEGGIVRKDQLLYTIEDTVYKANVDSAKAKVQSAEADIKQINAELDFANREYNRIKGLREKGSSSTATFEEKTRALAAAKAKLDAAKANLSAAKAALLLAENDLNYTRIKSTVDGRIGKNVHSSGNYITPATGTLTTVVQFDPIKLRFAMSEADYLNFKSRKSLPEVEILAANGMKIDRKPVFKFADNMVDKSTGTLMIEFNVDNPDEVLKPNGYATVYLYEKFEKPVPSVSVSALMTDGKDHYVYVVGAGNMPERRKVKAGAQVGDRQAILEGLKPGETVISEGIHKVRLNSAVIPAPTAAPPVKK